MTIDELLEKVRYASDTSVTGQLAAEVRRLRERERVLVEALSKIAYCYDTGEHTDIARAAIEAVKEQ